MTNDNSLRAMKDALCARMTIPVSKLTETRTDKIVKDSWKIINFERSERKFTDKVADFSAEEFNNYFIDIPEKLSSQYLSPKWDWSIYLFIGFNSGDCKFLFLTPSFKESRITSDNFFKTLRLLRLLCRIDPVCIQHYSGPHDHFVQRLLKRKQCSHCIQDKYCYSIVQKRQQLTP